MARIVKKVICEKCGQQISASNYPKHLRRHENHPETFKNHYKLTHTDLSCKFCGKECKNTRSLIQHEMRCKNNKDRIAAVNNFNNYQKINGPWNKGLTKETDDRVLLQSTSLKKYYENHQGSFSGKKHTTETKEKISKSMKKYLSENPDKVPYLLNHSSKMSYPEQYFIDIFKSENIPLDYHLQVSKYELDFYNQNYMIDVEIDGEQHYLDKRIFNSDRERDKYLSSLGWTTYRIRWSEYKKLCLNERKVIINDIKSLCPNNSVV